MSVVEPPRLASRLVRRLACGPRRESLIGDLDEQFARGRSSLWYWRQVLSAILAGAARDIREHKRLAVRAVLIGWVILVPWFYVTVAMYQRTAHWVDTRWIPGTWFNGSVLLRIAWWTWWVYDVPLLTAWYGASLIIGWLIARQHRGHRAATVLACVVSQLPWTALWAWPAWRSAHANVGTAYSIPNEIFAVLTLIGIPICTLLGGLLRVDDLANETMGRISVES